VIENPILNSPFEEPQRHFRFDETGITADARWLSRQNVQSLREETKLAIISRSPLLREFGPRSSTSAVPASAWRSRG
jgi:hypothetical protein